MSGRVTLAQRRSSLGYSLRRAAEKLGCHAKSLKRWEDGGTGPGAAMIVKMAALYGCSVEDVVLSASGAESEEEKDD